MAELWFWCVAVMLTAYVVFDGFDLGAGLVHLLVARSRQERKAVLRTIGTVWDGNEVWLLAAGGTLYFAFPALYASSFSGFYLALMIVLWLLILRGISIEFRSHIDNLLWVQFWDLVFGVSSGLLALLYGVALGNVVRGVPLDSTGSFFLPLWTNFQPGHDPGIVDWYTLLTGLTSLAALALHGALWVTMKTTGSLRERSRTFARRCWIGVVAATALITPISFAIQPHLGTRFVDAPWGVVFPLLAILGIVGAFFFTRSGQDGKAFLASCAYLMGMMTSVVFAIFPYVLPSNLDASQSMTISNSAAPEYGLEVGMRWWIPGMLLVTGYFVFAYRQSHGRIETES